MDSGDWVPVIAILSSVALPVGFGLFLGLTGMRNKHAESMELIKQGVIPDEVSKPIPNKLRSLRNGFVCVAVAVGIILGMVLQDLTDFGRSNEFFVLAACILLFLGLAYIAFYWVTFSIKDEFSQNNSKKV
ncbi:DUF6249 domain-containing protein [Dysgonomonas macrotermitis]|uniref:DUF6249 domain-containing protein n=1 Tax=Dysgonomonas macrotermitis TaxID=1346286 RepID=A0A1M4SWT0_9BACT|nr:DUF6249 domain-containing protein [Dysgonomonas macrotermitis]SHE36619.1 hypothetical protein SAMN05444362_101170 [Dysgonomonas macrotermitis]